MRHCNLYLVDQLEQASLTLPQRLLHVAVVHLLPSHPVTLATTAKKCPGPNQTTRRLQNKYRMTNK